MPSDQPSASTVDADAAPASLSSPRWKKPAPGPHPRTGDCNRGPNPSPLGPPSSRSELERRFRESAEEAAKLALAAAARGSDASVAADGGRQRLGLAGVTVDAGHGAIQSLWSDADEATLLAAAAAFRERTGRAPRRPDAAALLDSIRDSFSPHIDEATAFDKLTRLESKFLHGALGGSASAGTHDRRVHDLSAKVWGVADVVSPPEDGPDGQDAEESSSDERRLITERAPKPAPAPRVDAPMPSSERSSASSMDADAASASPSPPISRKRSPSPHGSPSRRSEPNCRLRTSAEAGSTAGTVALATAAAAAAAALGSNADGGREDVQSLEPAGVAADLGHGAAQRLEPADYPKTWSDADEVTLLGAAAAFRERTGRIPLKRDAGVLLHSIRGSISPHIDESRLSCKLVRFKTMFRHQAPGESATAHDHLVHDLSAKVWGFANTVAREARDASTMMPVVTEVLDEYWKMNERALAGFPLEKGLSLVRKNEGRLIETKWRKQLDGEMQTQMRRHDLAKEICVLLNDTIKGLRS